MNADLLARVAAYLLANPTADPSAADVQRDLGVRRQDAQRAVSALRLAGVVPSTGDEPHRQGTGSVRRAAMVCPACGARLVVRAEGEA